MSDARAPWHWGPWKWDDCDPTILRLVDCRGGDVASWEHGDGAPALALREIMAAAPELADMLHRLIDNYERDGDCACDRCEWTESARALLARIDGEGG